MSAKNQRSSARKNTSLFRKNKGLMLFSMPNKSCIKQKIRQYLSIPKKITSEKLLKEN